MSVKRVRILSNGDAVLFDSLDKVVEIVSSVKTPTLATKESAPAGHFQKYGKLYVSSLLTLATVSLASTGYAATGTGDATSLGGRSLIILLQKGSFYVGMGVTIWGIVEAMLGYPGWKGRVTKGLLGYISILIVPLVFFELQNSLAADVWMQIDGTRKP